MSVLLLLLFGGFLFLGMFFLVADLLKVPYMKTEKALLDRGRNSKKGSAALDTFLLQGAMRLSHVIRMDEYRKSRMKNVLKATGIKMTPEVYQAYALTKAGLLMAGIIPCLFLFPLLTPVIVFLAVMVYFKEIQRADEMLKTKRKSIEDELPRFVANLEQELQNNRDVLSMVENFRKNAGAEFGEELGVLVADMRSSSYEAALTRFEARLNSPMLSDVVRGLIGVLRGDNSVVYFQMLAHDFKQLELQKLKSEAQKIPPKIRVFSFLMLMCFLLTNLAIIVFEIRNLKKILKTNRGEGYIDICVLVLCAMLVIALAVSVFPVFLAKNQLDTFAVELCREAEMSGRVGTETTRREQVLRERTGLNPKVEWSKKGNIQLNQEITVKLTLQRDLGLFGNFGSFPITLRASATGKSEVYHK